MILKIAIVPVMLLSILWRNRREKHRRAKADAEDRAARRTPVRRDVVDLHSLDTSGLRDALARVESDGRLVSRRNEPVTAAMLRQALASSLMDEGALAEAADVIDSGSVDDLPLLLCSARLHALSGNNDAARTLLSAAADRRFEDLQSASRGLPTHLAQMLADSLIEDLHLHHSNRLSDAGPLNLLVLSGRSDEAQALARHSASELQRALQGADIDPEVRIDGIPQAALRQAQADLQCFAARDTSVGQASNR
ncbi:hypothetical protein [Nioella sp. MMSF_3534]|uniref:hypothetical protein n=1 Tax=Nioella sp. MMSF_3534 TaxID=3046720 RepID=UPI00273EF391|nr:hypothetical protein [Nioella sp. MMSF_3534]